MESKISVVIYLVGAFSAYLVRIPALILNIRTSSPRDRLTTAQRFQKEGYLAGVMMVLWFITSILLPLVYLSTDWLAVFDFSIPHGFMYIGTGLFLLCLLILARAHFDLARNWSAVVQIKEQQALVTKGIYAHIRHPIYSAHLLWGLAQVSLLHNWLAGLAGGVLIFLIIFLRLPREERLLLEQFGEDYRAYMERTGGLLPKLH